MKNVGIILLCFFFCGKPLSAQFFIEKGNLKVGIEVIKDGRVLPIDSLCSAFDPITNVPIDLEIPEGSAVEFVRDSITAKDVTLLLNFQEPKYINRPEKIKGAMMSRIAGAQNSYAFVDKINKDTLRLKWTVGYSPLELLDLYPAKYVTDFVLSTSQNIFKRYPDTIKYDWSQVDYIKELDAQGIPIAPSFPPNHDGLLFVVFMTETAVVQMKGVHDQFQPIDTEDPFDLLFYQDLAPGTYEFIAKPYADAPERLWLKYPFTIQKPWWKTGRAQLLMGVLFTVVLGTSIVLFFLNAQKRKEKELRWQQQLTDAELKAIRAQLNPHFLFNALNSIQNLVHQQENERANLYITKLSRLLRQVLSSSEKPFQELSDELQLTQLYLELEQLRFPFSFQIDQSEAVDNNTLVPVMLLQPYVENAVKHGMAGNQNGEIVIKIDSDVAQIHFEVVDNGPGLSTPNGQSKGIALGNNRIHHLNNLYLDQASVSILNRKDAKGVIVKISLPIT